MPSSQICVFDASALVTLLIRERGADVLSRVLDEVPVHAASLNVAEAIHVAIRKGHRKTRDELYEGVLGLGIIIEPVTEEDVLEIAYLLDVSDNLPKQAGSLSIADATCLAVTHRLNGRAIMSDSTWEILRVGIPISPYR